jgi:hypothetical protein
VKTIRNHKLIVLLLCCFLTGCVTVNSVKKRSQEINSEDSINKNEAVTIARMSMINSGLDHDYHLWASNVYDSKAGYWRVVFLSLYFNRRACVLIVEKDTGDILAFFEASTDKEASLGANPLYSIEDWKRINKFD